MIVERIRKSSTLPLRRKGNPDRIVWLVIAHWILGATLGMLCAALLLWLDVADLRSLVLRTEHIMWEALVLLFGVFAGTFGGVVSPAAVMAISPNEDNPDRGASSSVAEYQSNVARLNLFRRVDNRGPLRVRLRLYGSVRVRSHHGGEGHNHCQHMSSSGHGRSTWLISYCFVIYIVEIG